MMITASFNNNAISYNCSLYYANCLARHQIVQNLKMMMLTIHIIRLENITFCEFYFILMSYLTVFTVSILLSLSLRCFY